MNRYEKPEQETTSDDTEKLNLETEEELEALRNLKPRSRHYLKTKEKCEQLAVLGDPSTLEVYNAYANNIISFFDSGYFVTLTYRNPTFDQIEVSKAHEVLKTYIKKALFSRRAEQCPLKFFFAIENHRNRMRQRKALHSHFVMESPLLYRDQLKPKCFNSSFEEIIENEIHRLDRCGRTRLKVGRFTTTKISKTPGLADYLLKPLSPSSRDELEVDFFNSDICFSITNRS